MAKQTPSTKRELRPRKANGLAKTAITSETVTGTASSTGKSSKGKVSSSAKGKAGSKAASPKKASPSKATAGKASVTKTTKAKRATPKNPTAYGPKVFTMSMTSKKVSKPVQSANHESDAKRRERLKWFVWPPYDHVSQIPEEHQKHYKQAIAHQLASVDFKASPPCPSIPGTKPPQMYAARNHGAETVLAWQARYEVVKTCPKTGNLCAKCVEPGWQGIHSNGEEVWFSPDRITHRKAGASAVPKFLSLGFPCTNTQEGEWGERGGSGKTDMEAKFDKIRQGC